MYYVMRASAPSLLRESTDSLIMFGGVTEDERCPLVITVT